jgi:cytochrome b
MGATGGDQASGSPGSTTLVWDWPTRVFHWTLLIALVIAFLSQWFYWPFVWHRTAGELALVLVAFRVIWGFVGPVHARFAAFVRGPRAVWADLGAIARRAAPLRAGHAPAGGWMILVLLAVVAVQAVAGLYSNDDTDQMGPLYGYVGHPLSNRITHVHQIVANVLLGLIALHVVAVMVHRVWLGHDLIKAMLNGRKPGLPAAEAVTGHRLGLAFVILLACVAVLFAILRAAPPLPDALM